ncbi:hypothetical protein [Shouchella clausii]|uniref:hypothetical protein n=1 Tax=Shouchella clausii TaxID=79880 RepID=UPI00115526FB|nr:hypothetical protein [Shouchella clausii]
MEFLYISSCVDEKSESCQMDLAEEEAYILQWVKSIQFSGTRGDGGETNGECELLIKDNQQESRV